VSGQLALPVDVVEEADWTTYRLTVPYLPPSKNVYENWQPAWKWSAKRKWANDIRLLCMEQQVPQGNARVRLAATLVFASKARRDPQNYAQALWHWVPDALVNCGVLLDDREGCIEIGPNWGVTFDYDRRRLPSQLRQRTILEIEIPRC